MKVVSVLFWVIILAPLLFWPAQNHGNEAEEAEHWYFLHRVNDWDIKETATDFLCSTSVQNLSPKWETSSPYQPYVAEAKRRGLTEEQCAKLTGRFNKLKIKP